MTNRANIGITESTLQNYKYHRFRPLLSFFEQRKRVFYAFYLNLIGV